MDARYAQKEITLIWSDPTKTGYWDRTELAVILAREQLGHFPHGTHERISRALKSHPVDLEWWKQRDSEIHHDLNAYLEERRRHLTDDLQEFLHLDMTSYDTEEPAFARMLLDSYRVVMDELPLLEEKLIQQARLHRRTLMVGRTHGQAGDIQTFGKRVLTWIAALRLAKDGLKAASHNLGLSRLSGAMGNYTGISPEVESVALRSLGFAPFYGATQIMPRALYVPLASALCTLVSVIEKIALDIRLGARTPDPIYQEPFGKVQKGSSAMPHKKNPIKTEQLAGMGIMARGYNVMLTEIAVTWEERAIEQSCVERVAWSDLFHVTVHSLRSLTKVIVGLRVYPDVMLKELHATRLCYAASVAKEVLRKLGEGHWKDPEEPYRIVQLAAFNVFEPSPMAKQMRADEVWPNPEELETPYVTIEQAIAGAQLRVSEELLADDSQVKRWNEILRTIFIEPGNRSAFAQAFNINKLLENEAVLFKEIVGDN